jgi:hypothetical protein
MLLIILLILYNGPKPPSPLFEKSSVANAILPKSKEAKLKLNSLGTYSRNTKYDFQGNNAWPICMPLCTSGLVAVWWIENRCGKKKLKLNFLISWFLVPINQFPAQKSRKPCPGYTLTAHHYKSISFSPISQTSFLNLKTENCFVKLNQTGLILLDFSSNMITCTSLDTLSHNQSILAGHSLNTVAHSKSTPPPPAHTKWSSLSLSLILIFICYLHYLFTQPLD